MLNRPKETFPSGDLKKKKNKNYQLWFFYLPFNYYVHTISFNEM